MAVDSIPLGSGARWGGSVRGLGHAGAHSQASSLDELSENLREVIAMLLEDGLPELEAEFAGIQTITA